MAKSIILVCAVITLLSVLLMAGLSGVHVFSKPMFYANLVGATVLMAAYFRMRRRGVVKLTA